MDTASTRAQGEDAAGDGISGEPVLVRRSGQGWQVGPEETADLTSAMVLADLLAADLGAPAVPRRVPPAGPAHGSPDTQGVQGPQEVQEAQEVQGAQGAQGAHRAQGAAADEAARLAVTVAQLEHALAARVRVEQAIGVLAERHRLRPRQAFDLLRTAARSRGQRVTDIAGTVVDSTSNPLLPLPEELVRKQLPPRRRGRSPRHSRTGENVGGPR